MDRWTSAFSDQWLAWGGQKGTRMLEIAILLVAVVAVAFADVCLKRATTSGNLGLALQSPWLWLAAALYLGQLLIFTYAFTAGWKLGLVGALQTALYAVVVIGFAVVLYRESLTVGQWLGVGLAVGGAVLINVS
jgi:uncharacterized membrane protein